MTYVNGACRIPGVNQGSCVFGDDCLFPCRCQDKAKCNSDMGTCSECMGGLPRPSNHPDRFNWGGAACQTGNVAYKKTTNQSGVYDGLVSSKGVDGLLGSHSSQSNCAHPQNNGGVAAWFYVDLGSVHQIHNVTVYNTFNAGACQNGSFGVNCSGECGQCKDASCSPVNGHCSDGCQLWFAGDLCKEELCENPYYVSIYSYIESNPAVPSLDGLTPTLREVTETSVAITWRQDPQIPQEYAHFYGYTVAYAEGYDDPMNDQRFDHDSSTQDQTVIVSNLNAHQEYSFRVKCFREMDDQKEYGTPSNITRIRLTTGENKSALIAGVVVGVAVAIAVAVAVLLLLRKKKKKKATYSEDNGDVPIIIPITKVKEGVENANYESPIENVNPGSQVLLGSSPDAEVGRHESDAKPLTLDQLEAYITKKKSDQNGFNAEYQASVNVT
ncbi:hypothetical protein CAPTEDRAFT_209127 [Capitella teleta]|uniref:Fibronectin type-III domain-containing protein n=1 Tax=Capitella teleta TaxID=283909 RepID=R7T5A4_CAPTE|nr:hypothetical protein CAPTEDRAFT_209127 [Capitella teleta]|eukprot:ELT88268.1 hypothetical protein CAPTEDRAFT_209127 [Capitella teleta]